MDDPVLRVEDVETVVGTMAVRPCNKLLVERKDVVLQVAFKLLHVLPPSLPTPELLPRGEKIL
ncbi:MAG: hypothetical protein AAB413_03530 [Patescibacteria group bacterium]